MSLQPIDVIRFYEFWQDGVMAAAKNARALLRMADEPVTLKNIARLIEGAPRSVRDLMEGSDWRPRSYCYQCLEKADGRLRDDPLVRCYNPAFLAVELYFVAYFPMRTTEAQHMLTETFRGIAAGMDE